MFWPWQGVLSLGVLRELGAGSGCSWSGLEGFGKQGSVQGQAGSNSLPSLSLGAQELPASGCAEMFFLQLCNSPATPGAGLCFPSAGVQRSLVVLCLCPCPWGGDSCHSCLAWGKDRHPGTPARLGQAQGS